MKNEHDIFNTLGALGMDERGRARMREALLTYADENPVRPEAEQASTYFMSARFSLYASTLAVVLVLGTSISFASEGSAPGDALYSIKVRVNEPLITALATNDEAKARVASKLAVRRLDEVVLLASSGRLDEASQTELETAFDKNVEAVKEHTDALALRGKHDAAETVKAEFGFSLASEAQTLSTASPHPTEKTKGLLRKVIALSAGDLRGEGEENSTAAKLGEDSSSHRGQVALLGSTTALTASTTVVRKEGVSKFRPRVLLLTASTTLTKLLEPSRDAIPVSEDTAVRTVEREPDDDDSTLLFDR